jgi:hypothetical protein
MEVLTVVAIAPACFGLALLLQFGILKAIVWALAAKNRKPSTVPHIAL